MVYLGGSAGVSKPTWPFCAALPADTGMGLVIAPHRALEYVHLLPQLLSSVMGMPVVEVKQGMRLEPNRVFVVPPRVDMSLACNVFNLRTPSRPPGWPKTFNTFLCSLAETAGPREVIRRFI